ncbi:MAG TPA: collagen-like protein [Solirubrobacteraceae bacterium]|jgi:hypothetical protein|nr:collagen-like protein [Solirubrobacteraceae bacterium]
MSSRAVVSRRSVFAVLASLCAALAVLALASVSAFASPPSHTQVIDSPNSLNAVSCVPQTSECVVTDSKGNAFYATNMNATSSATWTAWTGPGTPSQAVACPSNSLCVLADGEAPEGGGGNVYYATSLDGVWKEAFSPVFGVDSVSCGSTSLCVSGQAEGVIRYSTSPASEEWFALEIGSGTMSAVDCLTSSFCAVVDSTGNVHVADTAAKIKELAGWKSTDVDGTTPLHGVACTSTTSCVAVDGEGNALDLTINGSGQATVAKHDIDGTNDLTAITCTEGFMCAAVDSKGNVFVSSDGGTTWSDQLALGSDLTSVSCASTSLCVTDDTTGNVTAFASPVFPLTVFITGEGEVTSTPAGIKCSTEECTHTFEGQVTLTEAEAGAGYEFAGWIGCKRVSATTCTVDLTAASEVTAVFLKAGKEGATGKEGPAGKEGATGNEGKTGATGPAGEKGATGVAGPEGPAGAQGPTGPAGKVELVTCKKVAKKQKCTAKLVSGTASFTTSGAAAQATLSRHGVVYAAGTSSTVSGRMSLRLLPVRRLQPGKYTLTLISGTGEHKRISSESFTLS